MAQKKQSSGSYHLWLEHGYIMFAETGDINVSELSRTIQVSRTSFYHYWDNSIELFYKDLVAYHMTRCKMFLKPEHEYGQGPSESWKMHTISFQRLASNKLPEYSKELEVIEKAVQSKWIIKVRETYEMTSIEAHAIWPMYSFYIFSSSVLKRSHTESVSTFMSLLNQMYKRKK